MPFPEADNQTCVDLIRRPTLITCLNRWGVHDIAIHGCFDADRRPVIFIATYKGFHGQQGDPMIKHIGCMDQARKPQWTDLPRCQCDDASKVWIYQTDKREHIVFESGYNPCVQVRPDEVICGTWSWDREETQCLPVFGPIQCELCTDCKLFDIIGDSVCATGPMNPVLTQWPQYRNILPACIKTPYLHRVGAEGTIGSYVYRADGVETIWTREWLAPNGSSTESVFHIFQHVEMYASINWDCDSGPRAAYSIVLSRVEHLIGVNDPWPTYEWINGVVRAGSSPEISPLNVATGSGAYQLPGPMDCARKYSFEILPQPELLYGGGSAEASIACSDNNVCLQKVYSYTYCGVSYTVTDDQDGNPRVVIDGTTFIGTWDHGGALCYPRFSIRLDPCTPRPSIPSTVTICGRTYPVILVGGWPVIEIPMINGGSVRHYGIWTSANNLCDCELSFDLPKWCPNIPHTETDLGGGRWRIHIPLCDKDYEGTYLGNCTWNWDDPPPPDCDSVADCDDIYTAIRAVVSNNTLRVNISDFCHWLSFLNGSYTFDDPYDDCFFNIGYDGSVSLCKTVIFGATTIELSLRFVCIAGPPLRVRTYVGIKANALIVETPDGQLYSSGCNYNYETGLCDLSTLGDGSGMILGSSNDYFEHNAICMGSINDFRLEGQADVSVPTSYPDMGASWCEYDDRHPTKCKPHFRDSGAGPACTGKIAWTTI